MVENIPFFWRTNFLFTISFKWGASNTVICSLSWSYKRMVRKGWTGWLSFFIVVVDIEHLEENILNTSENLKNGWLHSSVLNLNKGNTQIKYRRKISLRTNHGNCLRLIWDREVSTGDRLFKKKKKKGRRKKILKCENLKLGSRISTSKGLSFCPE